MIHCHHYSEILKGEGVVEDALRGDLQAIYGLRLMKDVVRKDLIRKERLPPRMIRTRYLVMNTKGLGFAESVGRPSKLLDSVRDAMVEMIGGVPGEVYAQ